MNIESLIRDHYLPHAQRTLKPRSYAEYARLLERHVLPKVGRRLVDSFDLSAAEHLHAALSAAGPVQANRALAALSAAFSYGVARKLAKNNPCSGVHRNREAARETFLSPEECKRVLTIAEQMRNEQAQAIALILLTGCRPAEILGCSREWRKGATIRLPDSKTGAGTIYLSEAAAAVLDRLPARSDGRYLTPGLSLRRTWEAIVEAAGIPKVRLYDLRHSFASTLINDGVPLAVVGMLLRHKKLQTTLRYAHLAPTTALDAVARAANQMGVTK